MRIHEIFGKIKDKPVLVIVPTEHEAQSLAAQLNARYFPSHDVFPFEDIPVSFSVRKNRIETLWELANGSRIIVVTTLHALSRKTFSCDQLKTITRVLRVGDEFRNFQEFLFKIGYEKTFLVRGQGEFSIRGDIVDFFGPLYNRPVRIEVFGNKIEDIRSFDVISQRSVETLKQVVLLPCREYVGFIHSFDTVPGKAGSNSTIFDYASFNTFIVDFEKCQEEFAKRERESREILQNDLIEEYVTHSQVTLAELIKHIGEFTPLELDPKTLKATIRISNVEELTILDEEELSAGDYVVHKDYGIGVYKGVERVRNALGLREYIVIGYEDSTIYVPVERLDRVHKYIGDIQNVKIDRLNSRSWTKRVEKVRQNLREKVSELIQIYIKRQQTTGLRLVGDVELERAFAQTFPYVETQDQAMAIEEVLNDLTSDQPMDRLLCGDAGYGKTEVALRAAFRSVVSGKQVAVLVPTTILGRQHYKVFKERMEPFGIHVELIDRFVSKTQKDKIVEELRSGRIDVIIGTHALLSNRINFSDLGLVIIDEEQNFGVIQKEKFKTMRVNVNVLSLSATPIPRTLHMALTGMKDMSVLNTPPFGRLPVITYAVGYSELLIRAAILREVNRGGQVIYVHNRIQEIYDVYEKLKKIIPEVRIVVAHGRMCSRELAEAVKSFYEHESDVILCTSILENGIDIPNANTLIVDDSHRYGLAQLYQLRGRVGRSDRRAFAYFLYDSEQSDLATRRLQVIKQFSGPGSGLQIAMKDMQMRGIGSVFGLEQHGGINEIGLNLYMEILSEQLREAKGESVIDQYHQIDTEIEGIPGELIIPSDYIDNPIERMRIYRRLASCKSTEEVDDILFELRDRFGDCPQQVKLLGEVLKLRLMAYFKGIKKIRYAENVLEIVSEKQLSFRTTKKYLYNERFGTYYFYNIEPDDTVIYLRKLLS